jgi:hypothetical protein
VAPNPCVVPVATLIAREKSTTMTDDRNTSTSPSAAADDTAGFSDPIPGLDVKPGKNPTRPALAPSLGGLPPSLGVPSLGGADVIGFGSINTTRSNIKSNPAIVAPLSLGGGLTPQLPAVNGVVSEFGIKENGVR